MSLVKMANDYDDYSQSMLNSAMCSERCPCYKADNFDEKGSGYDQYLNLSEQYYSIFGRTFFPPEKTEDVKDVEGFEPQPFVWDTDRNKSFESFMECYNAWKSNAKNDPEVKAYFNKMFTSRSF